MTQSCQLCDGGKFEILLTVHNANFSSRINRYDIIRCTGCELATMDPFPTQSDFDEIYVQEKTFSRTTKNPYRRNILFRFLEPLYRHWGDGRHFIVRNSMRLAPGSGKTRVLDIGCGTGALLEGFRTMAKGAIPQGIDIDPGARENAREGLRDSIVIGDFLTYNSPNPYDIITMEMVVEHLPNMTAYIQRCVDLLAPGGVLFLSTPDMDSPQAKAFGENWRLVNDANRKVGHIFWFNRHAIEFIAKKFSLEISFVRNRGDLIAYLPQWMQRTLRSVLGTDPSSGRIIRWYPIRILWALLITGFLSERLDKGEYIYAFLTKPVQRKA